MDITYALFALSTGAVLAAAILNADAVVDWLEELLARYERQG